MRLAAIALTVTALTALGLGWWVARANRDIELALPPLDTTRPRPQGGTYVSAVTDPPHLNPFTTSDAVARIMVLRYTHDSLLDVDPARLEPTPAVARIDVGSDGVTLDVTLRDDVVFDDGEPLTVADCEFVWRAARSPGLALGSIGAAMDSVTGFEATGPRTFRLRVEQRVFDVQGRVGLAFPVLQARWWRARIAELAAADGRAAPAPGDPGFAEYLARIDLPGPGTGAYALGRDARTGELAWRRGRDLFLVQSPRSWRRRAQPDLWNLQVHHLRVLPDPATRLSELRAGRIDWYADEGADLLFERDAAIRERFQLLEYTFPALGHHMVVWNTRRPPFDQARVRRALGALFDRAAIVERLLRGHGQPAIAWFRPGDAEYPAGPDARFDPKGARTELVDAGLVQDGAAAPVVEILVSNSLALHRQILELAQPAFEQAGLRLAISLRDWGELVARRRVGDFDGVILQWTHDLGIDPYANFHSSQAGANGLNYSGIADPALDDLLARGRGELDATRRAAIYARFNERLRELEPVTLLAHPRRTLLLDRRFRGAAATRLGVRPDGFWVER